MILILILNLLISVPLLLVEGVGYYSGKSPLEFLQHCLITKGRAGGDDEVARLVVILEILE